tara:strand:- start:129148 stop:129468 length:321 start_codon:yes stop_codon:yes gene_type:complete
MESKQRGQTLILRELITKYQLNSIYIAKLSEKNHQATLNYLEVLKQYEKNEIVPETEFDKLVEKQNRLDLSERGAAGQSPTGTGSGFSVRLAPTVVATNLRSTAHK